MSKNVELHYFEGRLLLFVKIKYFAKLFSFNCGSLSVTKHPDPLRMAVCYHRKGN